jgi:hypothetical protein
VEKAYDTFLQTVVTAKLAAQNDELDPYRYECANCGEEVFVAAANSSSVIPHFRHRRGNNDVECENYFGHIQPDGADQRELKSQSDRAEGYFDKNTAMFWLGIRYGEDELDIYEENGALLELKTSTREPAFFAMSINRLNFAPDAPTMIPLEKFSPDYYLSNSLNGNNRKLPFFRSNDVGAPTVFKILGHDSDYKAKLTRGASLYANVPYLVIFRIKSPGANEQAFPEEIRVDDSFHFETMDRSFLGMAVTIESLSNQAKKIVASWGYGLEASEKLTLLWPPAAVIDDVYAVSSDYAYIYASFELKAHGNVNVRHNCVSRIDETSARIAVNSRVKIFKKNAEMLISKRARPPAAFDELSCAENAANSFQTPDDGGSHFIFNRSGVKALKCGQTAVLTPRSLIKHYQGRYCLAKTAYRPPEELIGEDLLIDVLGHFKGDVKFDETILKRPVSDEAVFQYLKKCEATGLINAAVKRLIEEGEL